MLSDIRLNSPQRRCVYGLVLALLLAVLTASLCHWQWQRAQTKRVLQAAALLQHQLPPLILKNALPETLPQYRHVLVKGHWLEGQELFLDNQVLEGKVGYHVFMPLQVDAAARVLWVNRGWYPKSFEHAPLWKETNRAEQTIELEVSVWPPDRPLLEQGQVIQGLSRLAMPIPTTTKVHPLLWREQSSVNNGLIRKWPSIGNDEINKHLSYAGQWLLFTVMILGAGGVYVWKNWQRQS